MKNKTILTDIDDTILCWGDGFVDYMEHSGFDVTNGRTDLNTWIDAEKYIRNENHIEKFNESKWFAQLKPIAEAVEVLPRLKAAGWTFVAISMVNKNPKVLANRYKNVEKYFPDIFDSIIHTGFFPHAKVPYLNMFRPTYWVEDSMTNAIDGSKCGHNSILLHKTYNENLEHKGVTKVKSWLDIEKIINEA